MIDVKIRHYEDAVPGYNLGSVGLEDMPALISALVGTTVWARAEARRIEGVQIDLDGDHPEFVFIMGDKV